MVCQKWKELEGKREKNPSPATEYVQLGNRQTKQNTLPSVEWSRYHHRTESIAKYNGKYGGN